MADQKLVDRTEALSADASDLIHVVDVSDTTDSAQGTSMKIQKQNLLSDYLKTNQTITLTGDASGSGTTSINVTVTDDSHTHDGRYFTETESDARFAPISHTHTITNVTGLQTALDGKSNNGHTHSTSDITNLSSYTGLDVRYYTEAEADTRFLRKNASDASTGEISAASFKTDSWVIDQSGTSLVFKYNGVVKATMSSDGSITAASFFES